MSELLGKQEQSETNWQLTESILDAIDAFPHDMTIEDVALSMASACRHILLQNFNERESDIQIERWEHLQRKNIGMLDHEVWSDYLDILGYLATWLGSEAMSAVRAGRVGCECLTCKGSAQ